MLDGQSVKTQDVTLTALMIQVTEERWEEAATEVDRLLRVAGTLGREIANKSPNLATCDTWNGLRPEDSTIPHMLAFHCPKEGCSDIEKNAYEWIWRQVSAALKEKWWIDTRDKSKTALQVICRG